MARPLVRSLVVWSHTHKPLPHLVLLLPPALRNTHSHTHISLHAWLACSGATACFQQGKPKRTHTHTYIQQPTHTYIHAYHLMSMCKGGPRCWGATAESGPALTARNARSNERYSKQQPSAPRTHSADGRPPGRRALASGQSPPSPFAAAAKLSSSEGPLPSPLLPFSPRTGRRGERGRVPRRRWTRAPFLLACAGGTT